MTTPDSKWMEEIAQRIQRGDERSSRIEERLRDGSDRMSRIEDELAENTAITKEVRDLMTTARGFWAVGIGAGKVAAAVGALYGLVYALTHGGKPPGG